MATRSGSVDLRRTFGWRLCAHARDAAGRRAVPLAQVLTVVADPDVTYSAFDYGSGRFVYQRDDLGVVVVPATRTVVTVRWRHEQWTDEEFAARREPG